MLTFSKLLLIQNLQPRGGRVRLHRRLIHQLGACRSDAKFAWHLHAQRVLEGRIAIEVTSEDCALLVTEFARVVPIAPAAFAVIEIDATCSLDLFAASRNWIFDHQVL